MEAKYKAAIKRVMKVDLALHKAKTHTTHQQRKISSAKRCKKWKEISTKAVKEYHAWIGEELKRLK